MFQVKWTEPQDDQLKMLWADGWSAGKIAKKIGQGTRNAVIGRAHRLGLANKQGPKRVPKVSLRHYKPSSLASRAMPRIPSKRNWRVAQMVEQATVNRPVAGSIPALPANPITIIELNGQTCRWPFGDPATTEFFYCGDPIACEGKVYCAMHCLMAYLPPRARAA